MTLPDVSAVARCAPFLSCPTGLPNPPALNDLIKLADAYAEARHVNGSSTYNPVTANARTVLHAALSRCLLDARPSETPKPQ